MLQKFKYLENEKSFLDEMKGHFSFLVFEGLSFDGKINKNLIINSGHKL